MKKNKSICIIEDDENYLTLTQKMIEFTGLFGEILTFRNGKEAFEGILQRKKDTESFPDFILVDINMPIWDAWDFLDEFSKYSSEFSGMIYIITSSINKVDEAKADQYPFVKGYLKKPVGLEKLIEIFSS